MGVVHSTYMKVIYFILCAMQFTFLYGQLFNGSGKWLLFMPGGSLAAFLNARDSENPLNWHTGMEIAIGAGRGLAYVCSNENIITSSNILLDANMNAKIADFGLSAANSNVIAAAAACLVFTADELLCATAEVMDKSTHGTVYKDTLEDGNQVAVKNPRERIAECQREFETEASALGKIRDINSFLDFMVMDCSICKQ